MVLRVFFIMAFLLGGTLSAGAADFDGSTPVYCAFNRVLECQGKKGCESVTPEEVSLPGLVRIDFQKNTITATRGAETVNTEIKNLQRREGILVLQGIEKRAWTVMISEKTGNLTLAVAGEDDGFMVFGTCMAQ
ncbi:MAG TPA: hypothetical protein VLS90_02475 [Thermodesulfobacteriota bacterium]|nr:hypothetical protein [Thermodesulfobacteriota bacterium]